MNSVLSTAMPLIPTAATLPPEASPESQSALINQERGQDIFIWTVGAFCIFSWDYLLCLPKEYRRIWKREFSPSTYLYIANRYFGIVQLCFVVSLGARAWSQADCKHMYFWEPVGALISTVLSQMILGTRVYVIYRRSKWIAALLILVLSVEIVIGGLSINSTGSPPVLPGPPGMKPPCTPTIRSPGWLIAFWSIPIFYDALAFSLTAWKAYGFWMQDISTPLFTVIWRDGVLYFFAIFTMNAANIIIFVTVPKALRPINLTPTLIFEIVLSCRLLLNLRGMNEKISSSNVYQKPTPGFTRSDPSSSGLGSKVRTGVSSDRGVEAFEMVRPQPIQIRTPHGSIETFPTRDTDLRANQFLDMRKESSGWSRNY